MLLADEPTAGARRPATPGFERLARSLADNGLTVVWVTTSTSSTGSPTTSSSSSAAAVRIPGSADTLATVGGEARMFLTGSQDGGSDAR
ncbi:MAG: hypothetical protein H0W51_07595 [Euzebyales bacterium]|nr:hypothetical protein [Euzebyales bacterium]